jgi:putative sporulation protein YyaC
MTLTFDAAAISSTACVPLKVAYTETKGGQMLTHHLANLFLNIPDKHPILFVCIGTDRSTGDALGPLIGSRLRKYNFSDIHLYGTLDEPVHAMNLQETLTTIHNNHHQPYIVGIDACLGQASNIGNIQLGFGPLKPGAGVNKQLPPVGHVHITGTVNVGGFMEYFVLQNTRLSLVVNMSEVIAKSIYIALIRTKRIGLFANHSVSQRLDQ